MSLDTKGRRFCDGCGRLMAMAHRIDGQEEFCDTCYSREFVPRPCSCGNSVRVRRDSLGPVLCKQCALKKRRCVRCNRLAPRAGKRVEGGVVCPACRPAFTEPDPCEGCGELSPSLSRRAGGPDGLRLCQRCRNAPTHGTCGHCRRYRAVAGHLDNGRAYCSDCGSDGVCTHSCPDCGNVIPGRGAGRCRGCLNFSALGQEVALQVLTLTRTESIRWLQSFATWLYARAPDDPGLVRDFLRHVPFFARLDALMDMPQAGTATWLLEHIPVREMREHLQVIRFLEDQVGIVLTPAKKREAVERDRLAELVRLAHARPFKDIILAFAESLADRKSQLRTQRQYVATAVAFCEFACVGTEGWPDQAATQFLKKVPGQRANLGVFFKFCQDANGWEYAHLPAPPLSVPDAAVVRRFQALWYKVESAGDAATQLELARLIEKAFALKRGMLDRAQVVEVRSTPYLDLDGSRLRVPKPMRSLVSRWHTLRSSQENG